MNRNPAITHRWIPPGGDLADASLIRRTVFVGEQGVSEEEEWDGLDPACDHIVLYADGRPVATGRIVWGRPVLLGRIAVLRECRGTGLGAEVVSRLAEKAFAAGAEEVHLHAQLHARGFYEKLGFTAYGEPYEEAGIPHISMCKKRPANENAPGPQ
jgi:predicted GNAT family N-acyltransferase